MPKHAIAVSFVVLGLALVAPACSSTTTVDVDAGIDAGGTTDSGGRDGGGHLDTGPTSDAPTASDAGTDAPAADDTGTDAYVPPADAGTDAFVPPLDMGTDAFVPPVDTGVDTGIACTAPFIVCNGVCVNPDNDINHCGNCTTVCGGVHPFCASGTCSSPPCGGIACPPSGFCCGTQCCTTGQLCCDVPGPVSFGPRCQAPNAAGTCDMGCPLCTCASPDTPIATPAGDRAIADLVVGDLVYSADRGVLRAVPIAEIHRTAVSDHRVVRLTLESGVVLEISAGHPTADGRFFGDLRALDRLDGVLVLSAELVPYAHAFTYDILPASDTATYVAGGVLVGSTLASPDAPVALDVAQ